MQRPAWYQRPLLWPKTTHAYWWLELKSGAAIGLDAAPTSLCPSADGALGLVATAAGSLWYFNNTASHDEEFLAED